MKKYSRAVLFHEAAHAVARLHVGECATATEVRPDGSGMSHGTGLPWRPESSGQHAAWDFLLVRLSGGYAEARVSRRSAFSVFFTNAKDDHDNAQNAISWLVENGYADSGDAAWLRAETETRDFLNHRWQAIQRVATALQTAGKLDGAEVIALAQLAFPAPQRN